MLVYLVVQVFIFRFSSIAAEALKNFSNKFKAQWLHLGMVLGISVPLVWLEEEWLPL
jgi:hypothetical protein